MLSTLGGDPSALSMSGLQSFDKRLLEVYGASRVVNVFKDTGMEEIARQVGLVGGWSVMPSQMSKLPTGTVQ